MPPSQQESCNADVHEIASSSDAFSPFRGFYGRSVRLPVRVVGSQRGQSASRATFAPHSPTRHRRRRTVRAEFAGSPADDALLPSPLCDPKRCWATCSTWTRATSTAISRNFVRFSVTRCRRRNGFSHGFFPPPNASARPKNRKKRDAHYSGRCKRTTKKRQLTTTASGLILDQSPDVPGRLHDSPCSKSMTILAAGV